MSIHIGLLIWKEMKRKNLSAADLSGALSISKSRVQTIFKDPSIDTDLLLKICDILSFNFFKFYGEIDVFAKIETLSRQDNKAEIERLTALLSEKNKVIDLKDQLLKVQAAMIIQLEKGQFK